MGANTKNVRTRQDVDGLVQQLWPLIDSLAAVRRGRNLSQLTVAQAINCSRTAISHYETHSNVPDIVLLYTWAAFLGYELQISIMEVQSTQFQ